MRTFQTVLRTLTIILGFVSSSCFLAGYWVLETVRPKMIQFELITATDQSLMYFVGAALLLSLSFCVLSLYQILRYLQGCQKVSRFYLFLLLVNLISFFFVFGDVALLNDIAKQYRYSLAQPEWPILYSILALQLGFTLVLTYANLRWIGRESGVEHAARDNNLFMVAQYVGVICGFTGLLLTVSNFFFPRSLGMMKIHTVAGSLVLLAPYGLVVAYWFIIRVREKTRGWHHRKQIQDIGRSSFLTLALSVAIMSLLFFLNFNNLNGAVSVLWLPFYVFLALFLFSLGNLRQSTKY